MGSSDQLYSLSWGEFGSSLASAVQILRCHGDLVDVTLAAGGRSFPAHKIVLSAASPFLLDLLKSTPCQHPVVMLAGIGADDLETLLEFVYRGEVSVEPSQLPSLLQAAHCLSIHGLTPPTILPSVSNGEESLTSATAGESSTKEITTSLAAGRKRRRRRKSSSASSGKWQKTESIDGENRSLECNRDKSSSDYDRKDEETSFEDAGIDQRDSSELNHRVSSSSSSPSIIRAVSACENSQHQDPTSDSEPPHLHTLMPMQPYSPLHIPQFPAATLGIGFPSIPCVTPNQTHAAAPTINASSSGKIRGASDCPGVCPLCGATLRQARNLRRHLLSSCKYRLNSYAGLRNHSPSDTMMIEIKPEVDMTTGYSGSEAFRIEEGNNCEQIVCKPSPLPSPTPHGGGGGGGGGSTVVSPHSRVSSPTVAR